MRPSGKESLWPIGKIIFEADRKMTEYGKVLGLGK